MSPEKHFSTPGLTAPEILCAVLFLWLFLSQIRAPSLDLITDINDPWEVELMPWQNPAKDIVPILAERSSKDALPILA